MSTWGWTRYCCHAWTATRTAWNLTIDRLCSVVAGPVGARGVHWAMGPAVRGHFVLRWVWRVLMSGVCRAGSGNGGIYRVIGIRMMLIVVVMRRARRVAICIARRRVRRGGGGRTCLSHGGVAGMRCLLRWRLVARLAFCVGSWSLRLRLCDVLGVCAGAGRVRLVLHVLLVMAAGRCVIRRAVVRVIRRERSVGRAESSLMRVVLLPAVHRLATVPSDVGVSTASEGTR